MAQKPSKQEEILRVAQDMIREAGYHGFSFREVASAVGIKSSSVHYYYPTKDDLGAAVASLYTEQFLDALGMPEDMSDPIATYTASFRHALIEDQRMCLCGMLAAERQGLPEKVAVETRRFFDKNLDWLVRAYQHKGAGNEAQDLAASTVSLLEGAMLLAQATGDTAAFDRAVLVLPRLKFD